MSGTKNRSSCVGCGGSLQIMDDKYMYTHPNSWGSGSWHVDVSDEEAGYFHWRWLACRRGHRCIDPITYINGWYCLQCQLPTEGEERGWGLCKAFGWDLDEMEKCWKHLFWLIFSHLECGVKKTVWCTIRIIRCRLGAILFGHVVLSLHPSFWFPMIFLSGQRQQHSLYFRHKSSLLLWQCSFW